MSEKHKIRLLVIEEDIDQSQYLRDLFDQATRSNLTVDIADTLPDTLGAIKRGRYDVILVGTLDNLTTSEVRDHLIRAGYMGPLIAMCDYTDTDLQSDAMGIGFADMLIKGKFSVDTLERAVLSVTNPKKGDTEILNGIRALSAQIKHLEDKVEDLNLSMSGYRKDDGEFHESAAKLIHGIATRLDELNKVVEDGKTNILTEIKTPPWKRAYDLVLNNPMPFLIVLVVILALIAGVSLPTLLQMEAIKGLLGR